MEIISEAPSVVTALLHGTLRGLLNVEHNLSYRHNLSQIKGSS